jgi:hypothetical protein
VCQRSPCPVAPQDRLGDANPLPAHPPPVRRFRHNSGRDRANGIPDLTHAPTEVTREAKHFPAAQSQPAFRLAGCVAGSRDSKTGQAGKTDVSIASAISVIFGMTRANPPVDKSE